MASHLLEVWQQTIPGPASCAQRIPGVIFCSTSTVKKHGIDSRTASNYPGACHAVDLVVQG